jgi:hypothetical protein
MLNEDRFGHWILGLPLLLCLIPLGGHADRKPDPLIVPVEDSSGAGSPLQVSGSVSFVESVAANEVTSYRSEDVRVRDISHEPILLIVASFEDAGPRSSGENFDLVVDNFFKEKVILPGEEVVLLQRPLGQHHTSEPFRVARGDERPPRAQFRLLFAQLLDGSTFGDPAAAKKWLDMRHSTLVSLKKLQQVYYERGAPHLLNALDEDPAAASSTSPWNEIRATVQTGGAQAAAALVDHILAVALEREERLDRYR